MTRPQPQVQVDFLGLQKNASASASASAAPPQPQPQPQPRLDRRSSFRRISKINPEIVKSVIASASAARSSKTPPSDISLKSPSSSAPGSPLPPPSDSQFPLLQPLPTPLSAGGSLGKGGETTPMTIFYSGNVSVFDLPKEKAQDIIKLALEFECSSSKNDTDLRHSSLNGQAQNILQKLSDGDMPIQRKKSLQRFFEKHDERLMSSGTGTATATASSYSNHQVADLPRNQKPSVRSRKSDTHPQATLFS